MYDNEYEWDILLFLRILKYLHTSDADMVNAIIRPLLCEKKSSDRSSR